MIIHVYLPSRMDPPRGGLIVSERVVVVLAHFLLFAWKTAMAEQVIRKGTSALVIIIIIRVQ